ncbi:MAG: hypothetical protein Q9N34_00095 [Aquificota bacterium]|nr:hypothetical protein [Aquificota bacterium]
MVGRYFRNASLMEKFVVPNVVILFLLIGSVGVISYFLIQGHMKKRAEDILNNGSTSSSSSR